MGYGDQWQLFARLLIQEIGAEFQYDREGEDRLLLGIEKLFTEDAAQEGSGVVPVEDALASLILTLAPDHAEAMIERLEHVLDRMGGGVAGGGGIAGSAVIAEVEEPSPN